MSDKNRERKCNNENYKKKQKKKRKIKERRDAQAISRKKRNAIRNGIKSYFYKFRAYIDKHIYLVINETKNTETVLLQKFEMTSVENSVLLALPVITKEMINEFLANYSTEQSEETNLSADDNTALKDFIRYCFAIEPGEISENSNIMFVKNCKRIGIKENLVKATVQPYNTEKWFGCEVTTIHGYKIYKGDKIKQFAQIDFQNLDNAYMIQDTLTEFAIYKSLVKKLNLNEFYYDFIIYARRGAADLFDKGISYIPARFRDDNKFNKDEQLTKKSWELEEPQKHELQKEAVEISNNYSPNNPPKYLDEQSDEKSL